ncbi:MAG: hypothetical protein K9L79_01420 [Methylobacter tundripaludum]|nr:hypothetical protein [Methylobacter tundripaludum]
MENIECGADFSIAELIGYMADKGAQVNHMERITVLTEKQRITLYVGVAAVEDVTPKLHAVK